MRKRTGEIPEAKERDIMMEEKKKVVERILAEHVEPYLAGHGGSLSLTEIRDHIAYVKFTGYCSGCPSAKYTLETVVKEEVLKYTDVVEDVKLVEEVGDELYEFAKALLRREISV